MLGNGQLPDWLRNKKGMYALDTFDDNLCLFRCIAVHLHQGARSNRCTEQAKQLAGKLCFNDESQKLEAYPKIRLSELKKVEETFKFGIHVYEPGEDGIWRLTWQPAHYDAIGIEPMTIGWYGDHTFLTKDIKKVANIYACAHRNQQFTQACHLQRHADRCTKGETYVHCPGEVVERP